MARAYAFASVRRTKVPLDVAPEQLALLLLEVFVERVRVRPVDVNLLKHREGDAVLASKLDNVLRRARLLRAELIARKAQDHKPLRAIAIVDRLQLAVVCVCQASFGGDVDDKRDLALVILRPLRDASALLNHLEGSTGPAGKGKLHAPRARSQSQWPNHGQRTRTR